MAPLKQTTIPKLELSGALLTAKLLHSAAEDLGIPRERLFAWTDSSIVLGWLSRPSNRWKVFVANWVSSIQGLVPSSQWRHVRTSHNPADYASRGLAPKELLQSRLWWEGPCWLHLSPSEWPPTLRTSPPELPESRPYVMTARPIETNPLWKRYSSLDKLLCTIAWCRRFADRARKKSSLTEPNLTQ